MCVYVLYADILTFLYAYISTFPPSYLLTCLYSHLPTLPPSHMLIVILSYHPLCLYSHLPTLPPSQMPMFAPSYLLTLPASHFPQCLFCHLPIYVYIYMYIHLPHTLVFPYAYVVRQIMFWNCVCVKLRKNCEVGFVALKLYSVFFDFFPQKQF